MFSPPATEAWLSKVRPELQLVARMLREIIVETCPELSESIKWGNAVFERTGRVCYLSTTKSYVSLGFFKGAALSDPDGIFEGTGKKMRQLKLRNISSNRQQQISDWVQEAVNLNQGVRPEASLEAEIPSE